MQLLLLRLDRLVDQHWPDTTKENRSGSNPISLHFNSSVDDILGNIGKKEIGFLGTPSGTILMYDSSTRVIKEIGSGAK